MNFYKFYVYFFSKYTSIYIQSIDIYMIFDIFIFGDKVNVGDCGPFSSTF